MTNYVVGFLFSPCLSWVVLIQKQKPDWQKGKFNGVGGKIEKSDLSAAAAMTREFKEETGKDVPESDWKEVCTLRGDDFSVVFFAGMGRVEGVRTTTAEKVQIHASVSAAYLGHPQMIANLCWLIPMAKARLRDPRISPLDITERP